MKYFAHFTTTHEI